MAKKVPEVQKYRAVFVDQNGNEIDPNREPEVQTFQVRCVDEDGNEADPHPFPKTG